MARSGLLKTKEASADAIARWEPEKARQAMKVVIVEGIAGAAAMGCGGERPGRSPRALGLLQGGAKGVA
jgi:hypothetical protein